MKTIIAILATLLIASTPVAAQSSKLDAPMSPRLTISERCQQLQINCTKSEVLEVGRRVQQLYFNRYNQKPPQKQGVNIYTTTDTNLIDQAIVNQLASENEKLRQQLELQNTDKQRLQKAQIK
ncbi:hypothetical protein PI95_028385 [Hassallia byssoidea VB512170]|uniref:Uncharacterized protein n=1 Tax=Hassallia byssoidea VB512170 TaxID=1304833 RepID=A0A846HG49_9CYAN|nr:hypothetical protein [Hassalia byssoidea]NEU76332.1 hypothetical protein [Hassalia byssoidea VB512170]